MAGELREIRRAGDAADLDDARARRAAEQQHDRHRGAEQHAVQ
jgi:hypothetical protein